MNRLPINKLASTFGLIAGFSGVSSAFADPTAPAGQGIAALLNSPIAVMVPIFLIFYFLMIRPQQKQQKERQKMISELKKGDQVVTTSGIYAKVAGVTDKTLTLEISDNVKIKVEREAVGRLENPKTVS